MQKNATHPPTQTFDLCKASLLADILCKTPWYVLVVCALALPLTISSQPQSVPPLALAKDNISVHQSATGPRPVAAKPLKISRATRRVSRT